MNDTEIAQLKVAKENWAKRTKKLQSEVEALKAAQDKLEASVKQWDEVAGQNMGLLPPIIVSKSGLVHENIRQPVASPVVTWRTKCGWPYGSSNFTFGYGKDRITCQKCLNPGLALRNEAGLNKAGA